VSPAVPVQPEATPQTDAGDAAATGPRGGKGEMRHYKLLYMTAERQWTEFDLSTVEVEGVTIVALDDEHWIAARNNDHANRIAFTVLGRPADGVRAFPVPRGAWKPKTIKPAPPKPERESLVIQ
jgi:hypothetical protein